MAAVRAAQQHVLIVGAGPTGMATAIELAQRGVASTVLEARGAVGGREQLANLVPALTDRLSALDPSGMILRRATPIASVRADVFRTAADLAVGSGGMRIDRSFVGDVAADAARSRGDARAVLRGAGTHGAQDADRRRWATLPLGELDTMLRAVAARDHAGLIDVVHGARVASIAQDAHGVVARVGGASGLEESVRGAVLIDASGRNLIGSPRLRSPEQIEFLGARFAAHGAPSTHGYDVQRVQSLAADPLHGPQLTVALRDHDRSIVWSAVRGVNELDDAAALQLLREHASRVGVSGGPKSSAPWRVTARVEEATEPARGRIFGVGDTVRAPYFMTSTGAAMGIVHDAPHAADAAHSIIVDGANADRVASQYAARVRDANAQLTPFARRALATDAAQRGRSELQLVTSR